MNAMRTILTIATISISNICLAGDPKAIGDVVGRDIDQPYAGHVGMWTGGSVLEVLANPGTIYENSLTSFKNQPSVSNPKIMKAYWGARATSNLTATQKQNVINAGRAQKAYNPQYTTAFSYTEGKYASYCVQYNQYGQCARYQTYMISAVFRCDTFVQYSYKKGANYSVSGFLPRNVWNSFPIVR